MLIVRHYPEFVFVNRHLACIALTCVVGLLATYAFAAPDPNWAVQFTMNDCSGPGQQGTAGCESYATDYYEHIAYPSSSSRTADIAAVTAGFVVLFRDGTWDTLPGYQPEPQEHAFWSAVAARFAQLPEWVF